MKFHENPPIGIRVVPCGRTDAKLVAGFGNFENAPQNDTTIRGIRNVIRIFV